MSPTDQRKAVDLGKQPTIAIVKLGDLGDVLLVTPLLSALRTRYPEGRLVAVVRGVGDEVLANNPAVDQTVVVPASLSVGSLGAGMHSAVSLRRVRADALVIAHHLTLRSGARNQRLLAAAANALVVAGLDNGRGSFLTHRLPDRGFGAMPEWRYWLELGALLGAPATGRPYIGIPPAARVAADSMLAPLSRRPFIVLHPVVGVYGPGRAWPVDRFTALAGMLDAAGHGIVVVGGDDATAASHRICATLTAAIDLAGRTSLAELAAIVDRAALVIGADSGVVHLAATLNRPTLALFGPSNHHAWAPVGAEHVDTTCADLAASASIGRVQVLRTGIPCSPCFYIGHALGRPNGCSTRTCLADLSVELIAQVARRMLLTHGGVE